MDNRRMADMSRIDRSVIRAMVSGVSEAVAPLSVINTEDGLLGVYDLRGLSDVSLMDLSATEVLELAGMILDALDSLKDILIFPEEIILNEKVIFTDDVTGTVRICVMPGQVGRTERENVAYLIGRLREITDTRGSEYLELFIKEYLEKNYSHFGLLSLIEDMKREAGT